MKTLVLEDNNCCFVCGLDNHDGLRLPWKIDGHVMTAEFISPKKYQGWKGIVHGGILATLLDEAMTRLAGKIYNGAVTAEMTVRYAAPAPIGDLLFIKGEIVKDTRRLVEMRAFIHHHNQDGKLIAHATGKVLKI